jgi:hypothetical protein
MQGLRDIFRSDAFVPTTAVFPAIDTAQLASELRLESEGKTRGAMSQPRSEEGGFDVIEQRILERVGDLRRKGIDNYAVNRQAYDKRLTRAGEARKEAEFVAGTAKSDFLAAVKVWKARMATPRTRVTEAYQGLHAYRRRHHLERPAHEPQSMLKWAAIALVLVVVESVLNAGLFAEASALGLVGGVLTALLISVINVACGSLAAYFGRNVNHVNWFRKLLGLGAVLAGIACAGAFNLAVAHFRDAVETLEDWDEAARAAWQSLLSTPLALDSVMSALLIVLGLLITLLAALKTYHSMDPYPGYAKEEASVRRSRAVYADTLTQAIAQLDESRDEAINTLKDVNQQMRIGITEAVDALYGQTSLKSELDRFLEHCDEKANLLLETYRDANRRARRLDPRKMPRKTSRRLRHRKRRRPTRRVRCVSPHRSISTSATASRSMPSMRRPSPAATRRFRCATRWAISSAAQLPRSSMSTGARSMPIPISRISRHMVGSGPRNLQKRYSSRA